MKTNVECKMLHSTQGSPDGLFVKMYVKGEVYSLPEPLFDAFVTQGVVEIVEKAEPEAPAEEKNEDKGAEEKTAEFVEETKEVTASPANKRKSNRGRPAKA